MDGVTTCKGVVGLGREGVKGGQGREAEGGEWEGKGAVEKQVTRRCRPSPEDEVRGSR